MIKLCLPIDDAFLPGTYTLVKHKPSASTPTNISKASFSRGYILLFLFLCGHITTGYAENGIILKGNSPSTSLEVGASFIEDASKELTIEDILLHNNKLPIWQPVPNNAASFGYSQSAFWIKQRIFNSDPSNRDWLIAMSYPVIDWIDIYYVKEGTLATSYHSGDMLPFHQRPIDHRNFLFPLELEQGEAITLYVRIQSAGNVKAPLNAWTEQGYQRYSETMVTLQGVFIGALVVMMLYNGFLFVSIRDNSYAFYVGFLFFELLSISEYNGFNYQFLWPNSPGWNTVALPFFMSGLILFGCLFVNVFLQLKKVAPIHNKLLNGVSIIASLCLVASLTLEYRVLIPPIVGFTIFAVVYAFYLSARLWYKGYKAARFVTIAWAALLLSGLVLLISTTGLIQGNAIIDSAVQICSILEVSLLSIALGDRINLERQAKTFAQKALMETQRQANNTLEQSVQERTSELKTANEKLKLINTLDPITGLKNRRYFTRHLEQEYKRAHRAQKPVSVFMIDIDHFKNINDTCGHQAGDGCIIAVANTLTSVVRRPSDAVARYGGEEFTIILPDTNKEGAINVAERLRESIESLQLSFNGKNISLTVSIGIHSEVPADNFDEEKALGLADQALYHAKETGRNRVVCSS